MKKVNVPFTSVSVDPEIRRMRDLLISGENLVINDDGTIGKAGDPQFRGSGNGTREKTVPHTVVAVSGNGGSVRDLINEMKGGKDSESKETDDDEPYIDEPQVSSRQKIVPVTNVSADQWYEKNPDLLAAEKAAMYDFQGKKAKFCILKDGRACWLVHCQPSIAGKDKRYCRAYDILLVYDNDHPKVRYGSSVKAYLLNPTIDQLQDIVNRTSGVSPKVIPHLIDDDNGELYLCSVDIGDVSTSLDSDGGITSAATSLIFALRWINIFELGLLDPETWDRFQKHGEI